MRMLIATLSIVAACRGGERTERPDPPAGLPYASAAHSCAPWDGPATEMLLTEAPADSTGPRPPYVSIGIWRPPAALPGTTVSWPGTEDVGAASRCVAADDCEAATSGRVTFFRSGTANELSGALDLEFRGGVRISGGFRAIVRPDPAFCG